MATAAVGIAGTVEPLVVPARERHPATPRPGVVASQRAPITGCSTTVLRSVVANGPGIEDRLGHVELADVVHERTPQWI